MALFDGTVKPDGIEICYLPLWVQEIFYRMLKYKEFDSSELSFGAYVSSFFCVEKPFVAIPVFTSRKFRHEAIYINKNSSIKKPQDLVGKKIGVPEYRQTAVVWIKGILNDFYDVKVDSIHYYTGPLENPEKDKKYFTVLAETDTLPRYKKINVTPVPLGKNLSQMLIDGEIDAIYSAKVPSAFTKCPDKVQRLFERHKEVEIEYFRKTGIFPIMHTIVIRKDIYERNRWIAKSLFKAFDDAKNTAFEKLDNATGVLHCALPWLFEHYKETIEIMGKDYWCYGLRKNYKVIETFIRYMQEQGIIPHEIKPEDLFAPEVVDT